MLRLDPAPVAVGATEPVTYLHGGALATCIDTAAWEAVVRVSDDAWVVADMRIDFVRLARNEAHRVHATARKIGRAQAVADVEISAWDDPTRLVALGRVLLARWADMTQERYTHGHHESVLRSHAWRTIANSAAYLEPQRIRGCASSTSGAVPAPSRQSWPIGSAKTAT